MNLIILFGPPAVGKMTVGQEICRLTGYKLLHNHMTVDLVTEFFDFNSPPFLNLVPEFRRMIVREAARSGMAGLVFTFVWAFDVPGDREFLDDLRRIVSELGGRTWYAELAAGQDTRIERNKTENRLHHKRKNDIAASEAYLVKADAELEMNSDGDFPYPDEHIKIDNTSISAEEAAREIIYAFRLQLAEG